MFKLRHFRIWLIALLASLVLVGCGGAEIESGTDDLLVCAVPNIPN